LIQRIEQPLAGVNPAQPAAGDLFWPDYRLIDISSTDPRASPLAVKRSSAVPAWGKPARIIHEDFYCNSQLLAIFGSMPRSFLALGLF
jgi:hypothetical protein